MTTGNAVCIRDNANKLMWETKTTDLGLRDVRWTYKVGNTGGTAVECAGLAACNTTSYLAELNKGTGLCGKTTWRLPILSQANFDASEAGEFGTLIDKVAATASTDSTTAPPIILSAFLPNTASFASSSAANGEVSEGYCTSRGTTGISFSKIYYPDPYAHHSGDHCSMRAVVSVL